MTTRFNGLQCEQENLINTQKEMQRKMNTNAVCEQLDNAKAENISKCCTMSPITPVPLATVSDEKTNNCPEKCGATKSTNFENFASTKCRQASKPQGKV